MKNTFKTHWALQGPIQVVFGNTFAWVVRYWRRDGFYPSDCEWIVPGTLDVNL